MTMDDEVTTLCRDLIRIDSSNYGDNSGPGERAAAEYVGARLAEVGIDANMSEPRRGRTSLVAHWGEGSTNGLLIHGHLDVVPAVASDWRVDPFAGEIVDGYLWGRGAVDMKDFDAAVLTVVRDRARQGRLPARPITLAFTADEEAGSTLGAHDLADRHPDWFDGCVEAIGEVGGFSAMLDDTRVYLIQTAEKGLAWMRLQARGEAGHGSMRHSDNAVTAVAEAVAALGRHEWPIRITPAMSALLGEVEKVTGASAGPDTVDALLSHFGPAARMLAAVMRNTTNPTVLRAGYKVNVVPSEATAQVDGRFLPGHEDDFFATLSRLLPDDVSYELIVHHGALETSFDGPVADAIRASLQAADPGAPVLPYLMSGATDAKAWDKLGIRCFGFAPLRLPPDLDFTGLFHGVDERVPVESLQFCARTLDDFLDRL